MPSSLTVSIGADASQALGQIEVLKASVRDLQRQTSGAARVASRTGDELSFAKAAQGASEIASLKEQIRQLQGQMDGATRSAQRMQEAMRAPARSPVSGLGQMWGGVQTAGRDAYAQQRSGDVAAYGVEMDRLRAKYNPLFAAQQQYRQQLADLRNAQAVGAISTREYDVALAKTKESFAGQVIAIRGADAAGQKLNAGVKLNRQGMMELQAAGINSFQALAAGMDPVHVAMMEGAQVIGGMVQGGLVGFNALLTPLGMIATAALAAGGAIAYIGYQAYQTRQALGGMQAELLLTGRGGTTAIDGVSIAADDLAKKFDLSKRAAAELLAEVAKARTLNRDQIQQVAELAAAEGRARRAAGESVTDIEIAKRMAAALGEGAAGAIKLAQSYNISTAAAEQMLKSGDELRAFDKLIQDIAEHIRTHGGAWSEADAKMQQYLSGLAAIGAGSPEAMLAHALTGTPPPKPTDRPSAGTGLRGEIPSATAAEAALLQEIRRRESGTPEGRYNIFHATGATVSTLADVEAFKGRSHAFGAYGFQPGIYRDMAKALGFDPNDISQANQDRAALELLRRYGPNATQSWAASGIARGQPYSTAGLGAETQFAERARREQEQRLAEEQYRQREIANRNSLQQQAADAQKHYDAIVAMVRGENKDISDEDLKKDQRVAAAAADLAQKQAALTDQNTQITIGKLKEQENAAIDTRNKIAAAQAQIDAARKAGEAPGGGGVNPQQIQQMEQARDALRRQLYGQETELYVGGLRERLAAETDPTRRVGIQRQIVEVRQTGGANVPGRSPEGLAPVGIDRQAVQAAQTELAAAQRQATADQVATKADEVSRLRAMGQLELQQSIAQTELAVAQRKISRDQAVAIEAAATDAMLAKQREAAQGLLELAQSLNLSAREIAKYRDAVKQIDIERQTKQVEAQTKQAEAQAAILDKWIAPLKEAFNSIGSSIESAVTGILTRKKTWAQAFTDIRDSIISSVVSGTGSTLSKLAAKGLGATSGEGLGEFLGTKLLSSIGLGDIGSVGAQATNTAALATNSGAVAANTAALAANTAAVTAAGGASLAGGAASAAGGTASAAGGGAALAAVALRFGGIVRAAGGMIVPSAAGGWNLPPSFGSDRVVAALTPGEMVLPRQISQSLQTAVAGGGIGGGGVHQYSINVSAIDSRSGAQFLMSHADHIASALNRSRRSFAGAALR